MRCPNCNREIPDMNRFCGFCGAPVYRETTTLLQDPAGPGTVRPKKKNPLRGLLVAALILVPLALIALLLWRILAPRPQPAVQAHSYAVCYGAGSWEEAKRRALESGGYPAQIDDRDEFDALTAQLDGAGMRNRAFLLGARSEAGSTDYYWDDPSRTADRTPLNDENAWCADLWADREALENEDTSKRRTIRLYYDEDENRWALDSEEEDEPRTEDPVLVEYDDPEDHEEDALIRPLGPEAPETTEEPAEPAVQETPEVRVEDAYRFEKSYDEDLRTFSVLHTIPRIVLEGDEIDALNQKLYDELYPEMVQIEEIAGDDEALAGISVLYSNIFYRWAVNGDVLSLWIFHGAETLVEPHYWNVYNISISERSVMSNQEMLAACGTPEAEYREKARLAMAECCLGLSNADVHEDPGYRAQLDKTASDENVDAAMPLINEDGHLCTVGEVYYLTGNGSVSFLFDLETFVPDPQVKDLLESPEPEAGLGEACRLYRQTLLDYTEGSKREQYANIELRFALVYIDGDEIPELCVFPPDYHIATVELYTIRDGSVEPCGAIGCSSSFAYGQRTGTVAAPEFSNGLGYTFYPLGAQYDQPIVSFRTGPRYPGKDETIVYEIDGEEVSREEYVSRMELFLSGGDYYRVSVSDAYLLNDGNLDAFAADPANFLVTGSPVTEESFVFS